MIKYAVCIFYVFTCSTPKGSGKSEIVKAKLQFMLITEYET